MSDFGALLELAERAKNSAYAPYSRLNVGAAILSASGQTYTGCNVENIAFPIGGCAEHHAIAAAVLIEGKNLRIHAVAIAAQNHKGESVPVPPCGGCRQMIHEFGPKASIHFRSLSGAYVTQSIEQLLPESFYFEAP